MKKILTILLILFITNTAHASFWTRIKLWDGADPVISGDTTSTGQGALLTGSHVWDNTNWQKVSGDTSGIQYVRIKDPRYDGTATLDGSTEALNVIDYAHHEIHSGSHYFLANYAILGNGDDIDFTFHTPNSTKWVHLLFALESTGQTEFTVFEDVTGNNDGTPVTPNNSNRNKPDASASVLSQDATITDEGTILENQLFGVTGNPSKSVGGSTGRDDEIVLKQNTKYLFRISSDSASNNVSWRASWYEHTDRN